MSLQAINPATGKVVAQYEEMGPPAVEAAILAADRAFQVWRTRDMESRAGLMRAAAHILRSRAPAYGKLMAEEMGKPIRDGIAEAEKCALACDYYAEHAEAFLAPRTVYTPGRKSFVAFRPLGVVLAVMPWNFPFWQVIRFAVPALMAGNAGLLKHASNVPGCALALEALFREAGFPENLFRTLLIGSKAVSAVIAHPLVRAVSLTGSTPAGREVAATAGRALKKTVLELGGSDAYIVLDDADVAFTAAALARGRMVNGGQSCIAAKRFVVLDSIRAAFEAQLVAEMRKFTPGDPLDPATVLGPMARRDLRDALHEQVKASIDKGAHCLIGGAVPPGEGAFYPPTVLTNVRKGMPTYDEEMFGPVAAIISARDEEEAVALANDSPFGLGGGVFTRDLARGERLAVERMEAGSVFVNATVSSDPRLPFGGIKESGYGRELSEFGIHEFVNIKSISMAPHGGENAAGGSAE